METAVLRWEAETIQLPFRPGDSFWIRFVSVPLFPDSQVCQAKTRKRIPKWVPAAEPAKVSASPSTHNPRQAAETKRSARSAGPKTDGGPALPILERKQTTRYPQPAVSSKMRPKGVRNDRKSQLVPARNVRFAERQLQLSNSLRVAKSRCRIVTGRPSSAAKNAAAIAMLRMCPPR